MDHTLIERIVTDVLAQLQPASPVRSGLSGAPAAEILLDHAVITADVLQNKVCNGETLRIGPRSILTPSARDWLKERGIRWQRAGRGGSSFGRASKRQLLIGTMTPAVRTLRESLSRDFPGWKCELPGRPAEVVDAAIRAIAAAESDLVVAVCDAAEAVACRANRNSRVRAAVLNSPESLETVVEHLGPNLIVISPRNRSYMELRNTLRACAALNAPQEPRDWE